MRGVGCCQFYPVLSRTFGIAFWRGHGTICQPTIFGQNSSPMQPILIVSAKTARVKVCSAKFWPEGRFLPLLFLCHIPKILPFIGGGNNSRESLLTSEVLIRENICKHVL